jgi:microcystin-dependent protein
MKHTSRNRGRRLELDLLLVCLLFAATASAQAPAPSPVPNLVNYQGMVQLTDGTSNITGVYDMAFYLYDHIVEGTLLWAEEHARVPIVRGRFNVVLGGGSAPSEIDPAPQHTSLTEAFRNERVFLQVAVGVDNVSEVRQRFVATPHAFKAQNATTALHGVPPGTVMPFAGAVVPYGWEFCDGKTYDRIGKYEALFSAIGVTWGPGDGSTTFHVPNLGGRIPIGVDDDHGLGVRVGRETHALTDAETPGHVHSYDDVSYSSEIPTWAAGINEFTIADNVEDTDTFMTDPEGEGANHNNIMPSVVVKYIIKW